VKLRIRFSKHGKVRFTSHRDVARMWERALRRASLPVAYSEGYSPRPRLHFGLALPTGYESDGEYLDVDLTDDPQIPLAGLAGVLSDCLPDGITVQALAPVEPGTDSLQHAVTSCTWVIAVTGLDEAGLAAAVARALAADTLPITRERKGREVTDDLRPALLDLTADGLTLTAELGTQPRGVRPSELLRVLHPDLTEVRVCRIHQWTTSDGTHREPLAAASTPHAKARAS
jgi:radical SAM-linked protein